MQHIRFQNILNEPRTTIGSFILFYFIIITNNIFFWGGGRMCNGCDSFYFMFRGGIVRAYSVWQHPITWPLHTPKGNFAENSTFGKRVLPRCFDSVCDKANL